jgi:hypothetical protein
MDTKVDKKKSKKGSKKTKQTKVEDTEAGQGLISETTQGMYKET